MKSLVMQAPHAIVVEETPDPVPGPDEVLLEVLATGICGSDLHGFTGENGRRFAGQVMGHETVAIVRGPAASRPDLAQGALVTFNPVVGCGECASCREGESQRCATKYVIGVEPSKSAGMAELLTVPAANAVSLAGLAHPLRGALVEPLAVGEHAVARGGALDDDVALVIGAGPIGQAAALALHRRGIENILITDPAAHRREVIGSLGFDTAAPESAVSALAGVGAPTLVIDAVGSTQSLDSALTLSSPGARVVVVGMNAPVVSIPAYTVSVDERTLIGSFCYSQRDFLSVAEWVRNTTIDLDILIGDTVTIEDAPAAFAALANGSLTSSKVLVCPSAGFVSTHRKVLR